MTALEYLKKKNREEGWIFFKLSDFFGFIEEREARRQLNELAGTGKIRKRVSEIVLVEVISEL